MRHVEYAGIRIGADIPPELPVGELAAFAAWAEERGFDDAWANEISCWDPFVVLTAAALRTERIRLGTSIVPFSTRTVPVLAMSAAALSDVADGRFVLGLGVSTHAIIEEWHGLSFARPRERANEALVLLRELLGGGRSAFEGRQIRSAKFRLRRPPTAPPPIALAAMGEKMLETAGELADAVFLNFVPVDRLPTVIAAIERGVERAGRVELPELLIALPCEVTDDVAAARARFARMLAFYLTAPAYRAALRWYGFEAEVAAAEAEWSGDVERLAVAVGDRLVDEIGVFGSAAACRARIAAYGAAGVQMVTITPLGADPRATLAALAPLCQSEVGQF